jgi:hypothetical protein
MTFEERLEHLKRGVTFDAPSKYIYRKPKKNQAPKMPTAAQKQRYRILLRPDRKPI